MWFRSTQIQIDFVCHPFFLLQSDAQRDNFFLTQAFENFHDFTCSYSFPLSILLSAWWISCSCMNLNRWSIWRTTNLISNSVLPASILKFHFRNSVFDLWVLYLSVLSFRDLRDQLSFLIWKTSNTGHHKSSLIVELLVQIFALTVLYIWGVQTPLRIIPRLFKSFSLSWGFRKGLKFQSSHHMQRNTISSMNFFGCYVSQDFTLRFECLFWFDWKLVKINSFLHTWLQRCLQVCKNKRSVWKSSAWQLLLSRFVEDFPLPIDDL